MISKWIFLEFYAFPSEIQVSNQQLNANSLYWISELGHLPD